MAKKMDWFRLYPEIRRDPKIRRLDPTTRWLWITILCIASDSPERGRLLISKDLPYIVEDIADEAGMEVNLVAEGVKTLEKYGLIECAEGVYFIPKWEERQYDNPSSTPSATRERKRKSRQKQEQEQQSHDDVTTVSRVSHDIETENRVQNTELNKVVVVEQTGGSSFPSKMNDENFARAYRAFESQFYQAVNDVQVGELGRFIDLGMDPELIEEAIQITRKKSKDLGYFWGILEKCEQQGLLTMKSFQEAKQQQRIRQQGGQAYRKTDLPEYVAKQPQSNQGTVSVLNPEKKKEAARLMLALGEITKQEFDAEWGVG